MDLNMALGIGAMSEGTKMIILGSKRLKILLAFAFTFLVTFALGISFILKERTPIATDVVFANHFIWLGDVGTASSITAKDCSPSPQVQFLRAGHQVICRSQFNGREQTREYFYSVLGQLSVIEKPKIR